MSSYPYTPIREAWKRPRVDRERLARFMRRSDLQGLWHSLGVLAVLAASGAVCYWLFSTGQWVLLALALYVHGGLFAFNPQAHHHRYTLHRRSEGERVHPKVKTTEQVLQQALQVVDVSALVTALYDQVYAIFRPYLSNRAAACGSATCTSRPPSASAARPTGGS